MKPRNNRRIQYRDNSLKGGDRATLAAIKWELLGLRPSDDLIREITGLEPTDPNLDKYLKIYSNLPGRNGRMNLTEITKNIIGGN